MLAFSSSGHQLYVLTSHVVGLFWARCMIFGLKVGGLFHPEIILRPNSYLTSHIGHISCVLYAASTYSTFMADVVIPYFALLTFSNTTLTYDTCKSQEDDTIPMPAILDTI
ncbi:hypothetical protein K438DRAFT_1989615 [Mycena galopus ATCC 62051]|nr:hypothetical protein K438DRAFT_1989615 [Mycena galopus ATCC 62051]